MTVGHRQGSILLSTAQWRTRALLLAELQEAGYDAVAVPGIRFALSAVASGRVEPALAVLDVVSDPAAHPSRVERLLELLGDVPTLLLVGAYEAKAYAPLRERVAAWLTRPVRVTSIVAAVRRLCPPQPTGLPEE